MSSAPISSARVHRGDIEGLRAVAVGMVLLYHAFPQQLPGGFFGVDVFFVISGFLITRIVVSDVRCGTFSLSGFYARRVRRLVPALLLVLITCSLAGWLVMTPTEFAWLGKSVGWSAPFLANAFLSRSGGYFTDTSFPSPLLHLWSLGVEEQFYLLWPLLLLFAVRQRIAARVLIGVIVSSLAISLWGAWDSPDIHFYRLSCRAWELAAGGVLGLNLRHDADLVAGTAVRSGGTRPRSGNVAALLGVALIGGSAVFLNADRAFPGWWSTLPTGGACLLISAGPASLISRHLLASAPFKYIGRLSYSLYLWHWPVLAFATLLLGRPPAGGAALIALAVAFVIACTGYHLVERPLRVGPLAQRATPALLGGLACLMVVGIAIDRRWIASRLSGAAILAFDAARLDWTYPGGFNAGKAADFKPWRIAGNRAQTALFIGDSHIEQYWSRVAYVVATQPQAARSAEFATYYSCPPLPGINAPRPGWSCDRFLKYALGQAYRRDVDTVVFGAFWEAYLLQEFAGVYHAHPIYRVGDPLRTALQLDSPAARRSLDEFQAVVSKLVASGRRVFIILSNPTSPLLVPSSMFPSAARLAPRSPADVIVEPDRRSIDPNAFEAFVAPLMQRLRDIAAASGARILDPRDTLCGPERCATVTTQNVPAYRDSNHLRPAFARDHATFLDPIMLDGVDNAGGIAVAASVDQASQ